MLTPLTAEEVEDLRTRTAMFQAVLHVLFRDFDKMLDDAPAGYAFDRLEITAYATDGTPFYSRSLRADEMKKEQA